MIKFSGKRVAEGVYQLDDASAGIAQASGVELGGKIKATDKITDFEVTDMEEADAAKEVAKLKALKKIGLFFSTQYGYVMGSESALKTLQDNEGDDFVINESAKGDPLGISGIEQEDATVQAVPVAKVPAQPAAKPAGTATTGTQAEQQPNWWKRNAPWWLGGQPRVKKSSDTEGTDKSEPGKLTAQDRKRGEEYAAKVRAAQEAEKKKKK